MYTSWNAFLIDKFLLLLDFGNFKFEAPCSCWYINNSWNKNGKDNNGRENNIEQKQIKTRLVHFLKNEKDSWLKQSKSKNFWCQIVD